MLAAGKAIDPYWHLFQQHFTTGFALQTLEAMRIGTLAPGEACAPAPAAPPPRE
jgi:cytochrome b561